MPTSAVWIEGYIKGVEVTQSGLALVMLDKNQPISATGTGTSINITTSTQTWFELYIGDINSSSTPSGATVKSQIAALLALKSSNDLVRFVLANPVVTSSNTFSTFYPVQ